MSLSLENSIREILQGIKEENLGPAGEMRVAERLVLAGLTLVLELQKANHASIQSSQYLNLTYTVRELTNTLLARTVKDS